MDRVVFVTNRRCEGEGAKALPEDILLSVRSDDAPLTHQRPFGLTVSHAGDEKKASCLPFMRREDQRDLRVGVHLLLHHLRRPLADSHVDTELEFFRGGAVKGRGKGFGVFAEGAFS